MPKHEDIEQQHIRIGDYPWWTYCSCGLAFGGRTSQQAYAKWEQHEADES